MLFTIWSFFLLFSGLTPGEDQKSSTNLKYNIVYKNDSIGYLDANYDVNQSSELYVITSEASFRFLMKFSSDYMFENRFRGGTLVSSKTQNKVNDKVRSTSSITRKGDGYDMKIDDKKSRLNQKVTYAMANLYFHEPSDIDQVFSERYGEFCKIKKVANHKYELLLPSGRKNYYSYKDGICHEVEVNHSMATFHFVLQK